MRLKIEVTDKDIKYGEQLWASKCPVGRASKRALTAASGCATLRVAAFQNYITVTEPYGFTHSEIAELKVPKKVTNFIRTFDCKGRKAVKPISFVVTI